MIKAVLLDLDDTLLINPDSVFVVAYLGAIDRFFTDLWGQSLSQALLKTLPVMNGQRDMVMTNADIALSIIRQAAIDQDEEEIQAAFQQFYAKVYPHLQSCSQPVAIAPELVDYLKQKKYAVVIATNPLYPADATYRRLAWAGLPDTPESYALVTHNENMHFTKNHAAYYAEIVARVGVEPDEAIMVGDSLNNDMHPAQQAGLSVFHVTAQSHHENGIPSGTLTDFYHRVSQDNWLETLVPPAISPGMILPELTGNIGGLFGLLADVQPHHWEQHPDPEEWSLIQTVCHLLESEAAVQRPRMERILQQANPFLVPPQAPPGPHDARICHQDGWDAAQDFAQERRKTLDLVRTFKQDDWSRPARHSIFGRTTLLEMAHFTAQHDRLHINQLCQTLGRCE
ncbi:MAG: DinB family protein [Anaerolineaceae bacterium]|nr:DinB family protein [Anaerolineaceae bacterium]